MKAYNQDELTEYRACFNAKRWYIDEMEPEIIYIIRGRINVDGASYGPGKTLFWNPGEVVCLEIDSDTEYMEICKKPIQRKFVEMDAKFDVIQFCSQKMNRLCKAFEKRGTGLEKSNYEINPHDISVVIQGYANDLTKLSIDSVRKYLPGATIILSTWKSCNCSEMDYDLLIENDDPGFVECSMFGKTAIPNNGNRQIVSTKEGLKHVKTPYTLRMRSDMVLFGDGITHFYGINEGREEEYRLFSERLIIGEIVSRRSWNYYTEGKWHHCMKPFHPSDWFMFGKTEDVKKFYHNVDLIPKNEMAEYSCKNRDRTEGYIYSWRYTTEQHLFLGCVKEKYPDLQFDDWTDWSDEIIDLSDKLMMNNFTVLNLCQHQMVNMKKKEDSFASNGLTYLEKNLYTNSDFTKYIRKCRNEIHLFCPAGLGDTMIICGFIHALEEKTGAIIIPIIKKSHESVMHLYGIEKYSFHECSFDDTRELDHVSNDLEVGGVFLAHPSFWRDGFLFNDFMEGEGSFVGIYREMLGLSSDIMMDLPSRWPQITPELVKKLEPMNIKDITLILPEMHARESDTVPQWYFEQLVDQLVSDGETVVVNMQYPSDFFIDYLCDLTLDELIAVAINCRKVISARSGFCDLVYKKVKAMEVIYANRVFWQYYHFSSIFGSDRAEVTEMVWDWSRYMETHDIKNCAIYGMGDIGRRLVDVLRKEGNVEVLFGIDRYAENKRGEIEMYYPDEIWPETDLIIVTPRKTGRKVREWVEQKVNCNVVLFEDILKCAALGGFN